ncbi:Hsp70 protein that interacts with Zuo1p [Tieghemiomyces parasiticus]|uniref:Hsp70 protein that interacts with Zuo1p n=1 Tax=Tieghemiomyces parasiticus TaxID=78921 RepID=A0A9W7ZQK5_9FUNG|nr:Hsp70 protein that interacts with Zuo1p [Tieghemiomyces parasiticus]
MTDSGSLSANVIGISLGSAYSCLAILNKERQPEIIANEDGEHKMATIISFLGEEELYGNQALAQTVRNARNTVGDFQPLIGLPFSDSLAARYPANALVAKDGQVGFQVESRGAIAVFTAAELVTQYLRYLIETAANYVGRPVDGVVLSRPAGLTPVQLEALAAAARAAHPNLLQTVDEAPAALLAYSLGQTATPEDPADTNALVVNVGARATTVAAVAVRGGLYAVRAVETTHDFHGRAFDALIINHFAAEFKRSTKLDVKDNARAQAKLRLGCEITKRTLSSSSTAPCAVDSLLDGVDLHGTLNRSRFDIMTSKLYPALLTTVNKSLQAAGFLPGEVDQLVLAGGSARVPRVLSKLRTVLTAEALRVRSELESDEVVALGCAAQAGLLSDGRTAAVEPVVALATTEPLGLRLGEGFLTVIPRYTPLPATRTVHVAAGAGAAYLGVSQGEVTERVDQIPSTDEDEDDEEVTTTVTVPGPILGELVLEGVKAGAAVQVAFHIGADRVLTVTAADPASNQSGILTITA